MRIWFWTPSWHWYGWKTLLPFYRGWDEYRRTCWVFGWTITGRVVVAVSPYTVLRIRSTPKMMLETLVFAQAALPHHPEYFKHLQRIENLIEECDRNRPVGPDGKHGDLHTRTCGCEDK